MKREGFIFERITCPMNIERAIKNASRFKRGKSVVQNVLAHSDEAVKEIQRLLLDGFRASPYKKSLVYDGANKKQRVIEKPCFYPDQIVHWALIQQIQPVIMRGMYDWSCGSIPGRGQRRCKQGIERWLLNDPENTRYCLKLDISKFYQSVDNDVLKDLFRRVIKDKRTLELIDAIIDSTQGLNIGNFTSQWFANFYLQGADHYIAEHLRHYERVTKQGEVKRMDAITYNARYVDDMVLFGRNKKYMRWARDLLFKYLTDEMHLKIKGNWQLFPITTTKQRKDGSTYTAGRDLDFLGFRLNHERTILRRALSLRIARRARKIARKKQPTHNDAAAIVSYHGFLKHSNSHNYYTRRIAPYVDIAKMKGMIANDARKQQRTALAKPS